MRVSTSRQFLILIVCLLFVLALMGTTPAAQEKVKVAGKVTATFTDQKTFEIGDAAGHTLALNLSEGTNVSSGPVKFLDSASVVNYSFGDLVKGNGSQNGYIIMASGADTVYIKWKHQTKTVLLKEGTPETTFEGMANFVRGTGQLKNIQGDGSFTGSFVSPKTYSVDWQSEYFIAK